MKYDSSWNPGTQVNAFLETPSKNNLTCPFVYVFLIMRKYNTRKHRVVQIEKKERLHCPPPRTIILSGSPFIYGYLAWNLPNIFHLSSQQVKVQFNCFEVNVGQRLHVTMRTIPNYCSVKLSQEYYVEGKIPYTWSSP